MRRNAPLLIRLHEMSGPIPVSAISARPIGMKTVLKNGGPTDSRTPVTTSAIDRVDRSPQDRERGAEEQDVVREERRLPRHQRVESVGASQRVVAHRDHHQAPDQHHAQERQEPFADRPFGERVDAGQDARAREEGPEHGERVRHQDQGDVPDLEHPALLLDHDRMQERGRRKPRHERRVLDRIPRPVTAPSQLRVGPCSPEHDPDRQSAPCEQRPSPRRREPGLAEPARTAAPPSRTRTGSRSRRTRCRAAGGGSASPATAAAGSARGRRPAPRPERRERVGRAARAAQGRRRRCRPGPRSVHPTSRELRARA